MTTGEGQGWPGQGPSGYEDRPGTPGTSEWQQAAFGQPTYPAPGQQPHEQPAYQAPSPTGQPYPHPPYPSYGQPSYQAPGQQPYPAPGQPSYPAPGQPSYQAPGQPSYPAPGQPSYQAPGQPSYPAPGQQPYGQPVPTAAQPYPQQAYPGQPTGQQPMFGQSPYGQQPPPGWQPPAGPPGAAPGGAPDGSAPPTGGGQKRRLPVIITVIAVVVALLAAGTVWFFARKSSDDAAGGQSTPVEAATSLLSSLSQKDAIGIASGLDPTEAHLFADMSGDVLNELKRLGIVDDSVSSSSTGTTISTAGFAFNPTPIAINDHVSVVELTAGTVTVKSSGGSVFSPKLQDALPELKDAASPLEDTTVNIADEVAKSGHPIRIATVDREGKWYVSLFYTAADNAAYTQDPDYKLGAPIPNTGGATPEDAMNLLLNTAMAGDLTGVIGTFSPDEMGVLHDYGSLFLPAASSDKPDLNGAQLSDVSWSVSDVTGGKKVSIKSLTIDADGQKYVIQRDPAAGSLTVQAPGQGTVNVSKDNIDTWIKENSDADLPAQVMDIIKREFPQVIGLGVVMVQSGDGKWYASPLRTTSDVLVSLLKGLEPTDIDYFISLAQGK